MEPEVRERFERIEAILQEVAERQKAAERRMELLDQKWEQRMAKAEQRAAKSDEKWDKRFEATRKLVEAGIGIVNKLGSRQGELERAHKAFLDSFKRGNGNGRRRG